jgi:U2-associated protein SR140
MDFETTFGESKKMMPKMFVKGSTINPSTKEEKPASDKGNLYEPALKLMNKVMQQETQQTKDTPSDSAAFAALNEQERIVRKKIEDNKKKSNLELFKEELQRIQAERDEKQKRKQTGQDESKSVMDLSLDQDSQDSLKNEDYINSTNIFISNLSPKTTEKDLIERFGKFGLLASVKIMWPRDDKPHNANCGFVAYMTKVSAEEALKELDGIMINGHTMRLSWSKSIIIPTQPIFIPPELAEILVPPPPSGLPFNAQSLDSRKFREFRRKHRLNRRNSSSSNTSSSSDSTSRSSSRSPKRKQQPIQGSKLKKVCKEVLTLRKTKFN